MNRIVKQYLVMLLLWFLYHLPLYAQKEANTWYFGRNAGITFNTDPPTVLTNSKMSTSEGCSSISNADGALLFYTDGQCVWNKLHQKMSNGTGLNGDASSTHSSLIVKKPGTDSVYYVFTADDWPDVDNQNRGVSYSVVDLHLDSGRGNVTEKNVLLVTKSAEKIAATVHRNGSDIWIAIPEAVTSTMHMFLLMEDGIHLHHTIQDFFSTGYWNWGQLKFSPNSKLIALTQPAGTTSSLDTRIVIADFDNQTGTISNTRQISGSKSIYGIEFSPSSRFIYFSTWLGTYQTTGIFQMDAKAPSNPFLLNFTKIGATGNGQLQLAPDGKIYAPSDSFLSVINYPDSEGIKCAFQKNTIGLLTGKAYYGLPTFYTSYVNKNSIQVVQQCFGEPAHIYAGKDTLSFDSAYWFLNNIRIQHPYFSFYHRFAASGYVTLKLVMFKQSFTDTFEREYFVKPTTIPNPNLADIHLCPGDSALLSAYKEPGISYQWNTGSSDSAIRVSKAGMYVVNMQKNGCPFTDTAMVTISVPLEANLPVDTTYCENGSVELFVAEPFASCLWSTGDTTHHIGVNQAGMYTVKLNRDHCSFFDSVNVQQSFKPTVFLGHDTLVCSNAPFILNATFPLVAYRWSNQSTAPTINANRDGTYWVEVSNNCGTASDTIDITTKECVCSFWMPNAFTPNNDNLNDELLPNMNCTVNTYSFEVYNRWGALIFETNDPATGWNGKHKQAYCDADTFFWLVNYSVAPPLGTGKMLSKKGVVTLLR